MSLNYFIVELKINTKNFLIDNFLIKMIVNNTFKGSTKMYKLNMPKLIKNTKTVEKEPIYSFYFKHTGLNHK